MRIRRFILVLLLLTTVGAGAVGVAVYRRTRAAYKGYSGPEQFVDLPPGTSGPEIGRRLVAAGVVRDALTFRVALWEAGEARRLRAGEYRFDRPITPLEVVEKIRRGDVYERRITFPEGLTIADMAPLFESRQLGTAEAFAGAAQDPSPVTAFDPEAGDLEGYLFPETYSLPRGTAASRLVRLMVDRFEEAFPPALRQAAAAHGLTVRQAVTLASLVERETARDEERPLVAAVYLNRLVRHMPMQCDPTVIYALRKAGRYDGNLTRASLAFDSPYNTYRYPGLPPGPIAAPGRASLQAAANPAAVDYLYFVSRNDGSHAFSSTLDAHNRNVRRYQVEYFRERRRQAAQQRTQP
jgi:peptidoglycan lytic transglycosylase G